MSLGFPPSQSPPHGSQGGELPPPLPPSQEASGAEGSPLLRAWDGTPMASAESIQDKELPASKMACTSLAP